MLRLCRILCKFSIKIILHATNTVRKCYQLITIVFRCISILSRIIREVVVIYLIHGYKLFHWSKFKMTFKVMQQLCKWLNLNFAKLILAPPLVKFKRCKPCAVEHFNNVSDYFHLIYLFSNIQLMFSIIKQSTLFIKNNLNLFAMMQGNHLYMIESTYSWSIIIGF